MEREIKVNDDNYEWAQRNWQQDVEQAVQEIRLLVDRANDLQRQAVDAERATAAMQYHVFPQDIDAQELTRLAHDLRYEVGLKAVEIRDAISDLMPQIQALGVLAQTHQQSL